MATTKTTMLEWAKRTDELQTRIDELKLELEALTSERDEFKAKFTDAIGTKGEQVLEGYTVKTWTSTRHNVDVKAIVADAEAYAKYGKPDTVSQFFSVKPNAK